MPAPLVQFAYQFGYTLCRFPEAAPYEDSTLSLHDALPISATRQLPSCIRAGNASAQLRLRCSRKVSSYWRTISLSLMSLARRSEEHTSEFQSRPHLVCRLLLDNKKTPKRQNAHNRKSLSLG